MANSRNSGKKGDTGRDSGGFIALPWSVMDSAAYAALSHPARSLLLEIARQFVRDNNGRLLASRSYLAKRGWQSAAVIHRAKNDLLEAGFIHETVKGHRPNRAGWYAVTWRALDRLPGYDEGAAASFVRGAYQNASLSPSGGLEKAVIGPSRGLEDPPPSPSRGPIKATFDASPSPSRGHHLEKPSAVPATTH
ncbi:hypothetical protein [Variovorax boronicumulans]|uniref:hypothetical protein n=1 Tax=Variovorax boronicumulans TaxID=436515 RepID=UPI00339AA039